MSKNNALHLSGVVVEKAKESMQRPDVALDELVEGSISPVPASLADIKCTAKEPWLHFMSSCSDFEGQLAASEQ